MLRGSYVVDDRQTPRFRVHRSSMVDAEVLAEERARIFDRSWLYVGHESELGEPHDFRTRRVGGRPVIFTRDATGAVQVFVNSCPHRGMAVELRPEGHGRFLKCFYHGWSFDTAGNLVAMPDDASYGPAFDRENMCLPRPPRVEAYRGFVFLSWTNDIDDLVTYLAGARDFLDLIADQSEAAMQVVGGTHLYSMRANWKLLVENSIDGYHLLTTHQRYVEMVKASGADLLARARAAAGPGGNGSSAGGGLDLGNGHAVVGGPDASGGLSLGLGREFPSEAARRKHLERRARLVERFGEPWANRLLGSRNLLIFPNLIVVDLVMGCTIRTFYPDAPDYMDITGWQIVPSDEDDELRAMRMDNFLTFWGPAGLATPDDVEALERCQKGFAASDVAPWSDISRGMVKEHPGGMDELQMRAFWRRWDELMTGTHHEPEAGALYDPAREGLRRTPEEISR